MERKFDFVIHDDAFSRDILRFYPRRSHVHGYTDEPPTSWKAVYNLKWIPLTADHEEIKKFALDQIDYCIVSDRDLQRYKRSADMDNAGLFWTDEEVQNYLEENKQDFKDSVENAYKRWQEAIKDAEMKNLWMKQFLDSLEIISNETSVSE